MRAGLSALSWPKAVTTVLAKGRYNCQNCPVLPSLVATRLATEKMFERHSHSCDTLPNNMVAIFVAMEAFAAFEGIVECVILLWVLLLVFMLCEDFREAVFHVAVAVVVFVFGFATTSIHRGRCC